MNQTARYRLKLDGDPMMVLSDEGNWVHWADHCDEVKKLERQIEEAANVADELRAANQEQLAALRKELVGAARRNADLMREQGK